MRLDQALVERGLAPSRARAQALIKAGHVSVDGVTSRKASSQIDHDTEVSVAPEAHDYVSRAALKLVHGLEYFDVDPRGCIAVDLGSSTGGFTEVLLRRDAKRVYAIDVGRDQLHPSLKDHPRVSSHEGTHARDVDRSILIEAPTLIVCDVSFISIMKALPPIMACTAERAELVTLVKPQFELGRDAIGKKGRVLTPIDEQRAFIDAKVIPFLAERGWATRGVATSPILGGEGTTEFLLHAVKSPSG
ncbi:MAG: TlyA family RNA methyltransferase [Pseudomonadota bacterium]